MDEAFKYTDRRDPAEGSNTVVAAITFQL